MKNNNLGGYISKALILTLAIIALTVSFSGYYLYQKYQETKIKQVYGEFEKRVLIDNLVK